MTLRVSNRRRPGARTAWFAGLLMLAASGSHALALEEIKVGRTTDASIFYLPTYIAMDKGIFREEGLDVKFVIKGNRKLTAAGINGAIDFIPNAGGARVSIKGAPVRYVVGQSQISPWVIVANPESVNRVEDLRGKTLGFGAAGSPDYEESARILKRYFQMGEGQDYKVVSLPDEQDRLAALIDGRIQGALLSFPQAAKAGVEGFSIVLKTGHYLPRLEGAYWVTASYLEKNRDTVRRFIRAIAKATLYLATEQIGSLEVIEKHFGTASPAEANVLWNAVHREFDPGIPAELLHQMFGDNLASLRRKGLWPRSKPMPPVEQFLASDVMKSALREIGY